MTNVFGSLGTGDCYVITQSSYVQDGLRGTTGDETSLGGTLEGSAFAQNLANGVATFVTVAEYDRLLWTPAIAPALVLAVSGLNASYTQSTGQMSVNGANVTMPTLPGGHSVVMRASQQLFSDVKAWYVANKH